MKREPLLTPPQVAARLNITTRRVQALLKTNRFPGAFRLGERWAIPESAVAAFLRDAEGTTRRGRKPRVLE